MCTTQGVINKNAKKIVTNENIIVELEKQTLLLFRTSCSKLK